MDEIDAIEFELASPCHYCKGSCQESFRLPNDYANWQITRSMAFTDYVVSRTIRMKHIWCRACGGSGRQLTYAVMDGRGEYKFRELRSTPPYLRELRHQYPKR